MSEARYSHIPPGEPGASGASTRSASDAVCRASRSKRLPTSRSAALDARMVLGATPPYASAASVTAKVDGSSSTRRHAVTMAMSSSRRWLCLNATTCECGESENGSVTATSTSLGARAVLR